MKLFAENLFPKEGGKGENHIKSTNILICNVNKLHVLTQFLEKQ